MAADPALAEQWAVAGLPALSMANGRTVVRAALPLPRLSPEDAAALVVTQLVQRARSTRRRRRAQQRARGPT